MGLLEQSFPEQRWRAKILFFGPWHTIEVTGFRPCQVQNLRTKPDRNHVAENSLFRDPSANVR